MKQTKWLLMLLLTLTLSVFLVACTGGDEGEPSEEGQDTEENGEDQDGEASGDNNNDDSEQGEAGGEQVLNISESAEIPSMDPMLAEDSSSIQFQDTVYEGLYRLHPQKGLVSGIAKKDETEISEDGLTWTFHLRDAQWSNGEPVTAEDFVYGWLRAIEPKSESFYGPYLMGGTIKNASKYKKGEAKAEDVGVKALDEKTLQVKLEKPVPYFESFAAFSTFLPVNKEFVEKQGEDFALEPENMLFNGPFVMTEWKHEQSWTLKKNPDYWDSESVSLDRINVDVIKDNKTAVGLYETGEIDRVGLNASTIQNYLTSPELLNLSENVTFFLKFNQDSATMGKYMQNENFRKAISQAFDKQAFIDVVYGTQSKPADYLVPEDFVDHPETGEGFRAKYGDLLSYDVEAAQEAWKKAKEELGFEEVEVSFISSDGDTGKSITEFFKAELEKNLPGLTLNPKNLPFQERLEVTDKGEYELVFSGWGPDYMDAISFIDLFKTGGEYNQMGYSNETYDKYVKQVKGELALKPAKRFEAMQEAEKVLFEDAAIAPVFQRVRAVLSKPYVEGMDKLNEYGPDYSYKYVEVKK